MQDNLINIGLYLTYFLIFAAIILVLAFALFSIFKNFKSAKEGLIGLGILLGVLIISYFLSPAESSGFYQKYEISTTLSKIIGAGLIATYITLAGVIVAILYSEVAKMFK